SLGPETPHIHLEDGRVILCGDAEIVALHTPGHTPDHFAYFVTDRHDADQPPALFSGDVMFVGDLGRPELLAGLSDDLAPQLYATVWNKLRQLPGQTILYPGHGAGSACGKNLSSQPTSTLDAEFATSPALQLDKAAFIDYMLDGQPRVPKHFGEMVGINKAGAQAPADFASIPLFDADGIRAALADPSILVIDARSVDEYAAGHVPGTTYLGVNPGVPTWMGWLLTADQRVVALVNSREQAEELRRWMVRVGFDHLDGYCIFDRATWPGPLDTAQVVEGAAFDPAAVSGQFLDVRTPSEVGRGTLPGAISIPLCELPKRMTELDPSNSVTLFCQGGYRGMIALSLLEKAGFGDVTNVNGGFAAITKAQPGCAIAAAAGS
ncbi:MAG: rhodanese-like domain-containing protein, partial [bacterium]